MNSMSEQWWEKKLNIRTAGKVDHFIEEACNPYEPTDYCILEALADSLQFVDEIDCTGLYESYDRRERILVFEMV